MKRREDRDDLSVGRNEEPEREALIRRAAVQCIVRYGAKKVAVDDIAAAAGVSRRTLYRSFPTRRALMESVVVERMSMVTKGVAAALEASSGFAEKVVAGTLATIRLAAADKVFLSIVEDDPSLVLERRAGPDTPLEQLFMSVWSRVLQAAKDEGVLRKDLSIHDAATWLMDIHEMLIERTDLSESEKIERLRKFVLPALTLRRSDDR